MIANRPLNIQAIRLEEAETQLRELVKNEYLKRQPKREIDKKAKKIIIKAINKIKLPVLKDCGYRSLVMFYQKQYQTISLINGRRLVILLSLMRLTAKETKTAVKGGYGAEITIRKAKETLINNGVPDVNLYGVPLQEYSETYIKNEIKPVLDRLAQQEAIDPDDVRQKNSLRNRAEMEVRYNDHMSQVEDLKAGGNKLVIASTHSDCSERCAKYQGRVYSLDGTSGKTDDGRDFVPLEEATENPVDDYTTKAGITYHNGLLGFNCRHYLVPYKSGFRFPKPSKAEEEKQYDITLRQRQLERNVQKWRIEAIENKGINADRYSYARKKAIEWNKEYISYSQKNNRAYYPSRTRVL